MFWELAGAGVIVVVALYLWRRRVLARKRDDRKSPDEIYPLW
ncbi:MAG: hypothetical protein AAGF59_00975 [Pseudomonadota bacterium]